MNIQIECYKPLIMKRVVFAHRAHPPPPKISRRMEFGGKFQIRLAVGDDADVVLCNRATAPPSMDIDEVTPGSPVVAAAPTQSF